jgi:hypothetical protein
MNPMRVKSLLRNEDGSVIVLALVMLVLLTIIGMSASSTSTIEVQIAGNAARAKQNLYSAEAAAMESVQLLEEENDFDNLIFPSPVYAWLNDDLGDIPNPSTIPFQQVSATTGNPSYAAVFRGVTGATSLGVTSGSQLYTYDVYGIYSGNGVSQVVLGYKKRF